MDFQPSVDISFAEGSRWCQPYMSSHEPAEILWTAMTKHPLSGDAIRAGLKSRLTAKSLRELRAEMDTEDRRYQRFVSSQTHYKT